MGFFDKVKSMKNFVTGGGADVFVEADTISFDKPFDVIIKAQIKDDPIKINSAYLKIEGREEVEVRDYDTHRSSDGSTHGHTETIRKNTSLYQNEITVTGAQELAANGTFTWKATINLPSDAQPIFRGRYARHLYWVKAGLDVPGNDPDSGWVELRE